jgi:hypothetical protein
VHDLVEICEGFLYGIAERRGAAVKSADRQREPSLPHDHELAHCARALSPSLRNFPQNDLVLFSIYGNDKTLQEVSSS